MNVKISNYDLNKCYIGCFSFDYETDQFLLEKDLNIVSYEDGKLIIKNENKQYLIDEEYQDFFEEREEFDVIEIYDNGYVQLLYSRKSDDNTLFITPKCNSNCIMCPSSDYSRREGEAVSKEELLDIVRYYPNTVKHITITGGEPFLIGEELFDVLRYLKDNLNESEYLILTNGRIFCLDKYVKKLVEAIPERTTLAIPIHSFCAEKHDAITRSNGSFDQTLSGISKLIAAGVTIEIRIVVSKLNYEDVYETAKMIAKYFKGAYCVNFIGLEMLGNAAKYNDKVWIGYREAFESIKEAIDYLMMSGINVGIYNFPLCSVDKRYWMITKKSISDYKIKYPEECERCSIKKRCGGIFAGSLMLFFVIIQ